MSFGGSDLYLIILLYDLKIQVYLSNLLDDVNVLQKKSKSKTLTANKDMLNVF